MKQTRIFFDKNSQGFVLDLFNKALDSEGFIVEKSNRNQRVITPEGNEITFDDLAVIKKGSEKFIAGDLTSLMKLAKNEI